MEYKTKFEGYDYRPIINVSIDKKVQVPAMYDTGADIAVISIVDKIFSKLDSTLISKNAQFKGFGGIVSGELFYLNSCIGNIVFPNLPVIKINQNSIKESLILPASMFSEFIVTINNLEKTIEFKNNSNQVCYNMHIGNNVYTGEVMCTERYSEVRSRIISICGEENCNKIINLLPDITPVLDDVSLRAIVMETLRNGKIE